MSLISTFNLDEYRKIAGGKVKVFIDYIYEKYSSFAVDNFLLTMISEENILESLEYYISKRATSQITAENYMSDVTTFYKMLSADYGVKNDIFINYELLNHLNNRAKLTISKLRETTPKGIAQDDQYEDLITSIDRYISDFDEQEIYNEVLNLKNMNSKNVKLYHRMISVISTKLVLNYALLSLTLVTLKTSNVNMENCTILVNDFILPLDKDLIKLFKSYLGIRQYVFDLYNRKDDNNLFVKHNGDPYIGSGKNRKNQPDYVRFFLFMHDVVKTRAAEMFADRRIIELYEKGVDLLTLSILTDKSYDRCFALVKRSNEDMNAMLSQVLHNEQMDNSNKLNDRHLVCPFCGESTSAESDKWVLVQFENEDKKHLACRKCKGK